MCDDERDRAKQPPKEKKIEKKGKKNKTTRKERIRRKRRAQGQKMHATRWYYRVGAGGWSVCAAAAGAGRRVLCFSLFSATSAHVRFPGRVVPGPALQEERYDKAAVECKATSL